VTTHKCLLWTVTDSVFPRRDQVLFTIAHLCAAAYTCGMFLREEIVKIKAEIERLEALARVAATPAS